MRRSVVSKAMLLGLFVTSLVSAASITGAPAGFVEVRPEQVQWRPHPAMQGAEFAVLVGALDRPGPLVVRVKLPPHAQFMPHTHPEPRTYTVISGEWKLGFGRDYDETALMSYGQGSMYRLPAQVAHFQSTGPEVTIVQIESIGPTKTEFVKQ